MLQFWVAVYERDDDSDSLLYAKRDSAKHNRALFPKKIKNKKKQVAYDYARPGKCYPPPIYYYDYYSQENTIPIFSADHKGLPTDMTKILAKLSLHNSNGKFWMSNISPHSLLNEPKWQMLVLNNRTFHKEAYVAIYSKLKSDQLSCPILITYVVVAWWMTEEKWLSVVTLVVHPMSTYGQEIVASGQSLSLWVSIYCKEKISLEAQYFNEIPRWLTTFRIPFLARFFQHNHLRIPVASLYNRPYAPERKKIGTSVVVSMDRST